MKYRVEKESHDSGYKKFSISESNKLDVDPDYIEGTVVYFSDNHLGIKREFWTLILDLDNMQDAFEAGVQLIEQHLEKTKPKKRNLVFKCSH